MAQNWELSGGVGYGVYRNGTIDGAAGSATAGIRNQYAVTGAAGEDLFEHFSGEVRYVYQPGDNFLQSGSAQGSVQAYSHTFTYDALLHLNPRASKLRPYIAFGAGAKYFSTTGTLPKPQPVPAIAGLTTQSQWKPAFDFGARREVPDRGTRGGECVPAGLRVAVSGAAVCASRKGEHEQRAASGDSMVEIGVPVLKCENALQDGTHGENRRGLRGLVCWRDGRAMLGWTGREAYPTLLRGRWLLWGSRETLQRGLAAVIVGAPEVGDGRGGAGA